MSLIPSQASTMTSPFPTSRPGRLFSIRSASTAQHISTVSVGASVVARRRRSAAATAARAPWPKGAWRRTQRGHGGRAWAAGDGRTMTCWAHFSTKHRWKTWRFEEIEASRFREIMMTYCDLDVERMDLHTHTYTNNKLEGWSFPCFSL